jgi:hypothetical protein
VLFDDDMLEMAWGGGEEDANDQGEEREKKRGKR